MERTERIGFALSLGLFVLGLLLNLGVQPLYLEEPRRVIIALEMIFNGNGWVPTQFGEPYYSKPPLFNWLINASAWLHGEHSEWAVRLPTVLSFLGMGGLMFGLVRRYLNREAAWLSMLFFFSCSGLLFYFSLLAEIDLFYSLLTLGSMLAVFHFEQRQQYGLLFLLAYGLGGLGFLTKGIPSVLFTGLTVVAWLAYRRKWRVLISWRHLLGMMLFGLIAGGYYLIYARYQDPSPFLTRLFTESSDRLLVDNPVVRLLVHLVSFPLHIVKDLLPGSLLLVYLLRADWRGLLLRNDLIGFAVIATGVNLLPYWLSPDARLRYIYMLYPLFLLVLVYAWQQRSSLQSAWRDTFIRITLLILHALLPLGALALLWVEDMQFVTYLLPLCVGFAGLFALLFALQLRRPQWQWPLFFIALALARLFFDLTVVPQRAHASDAQTERAAARRISRLVPAADTLRIRNDSLVSYILLVYLERERRQPVLKDPSDDPAKYYLLHASEIEPSDSLIDQVYEGEKRIGLRPPR